MKLLRCLDVLAAFFQSFVIGKSPELVIKGCGLAPVDQGALRLFGWGVGKRLLGFLVLEGVQECDASLDRGLDVRGATGGEVHFAKLVRQRGVCSTRANCRGLKSK